jgi:hypothetical protein
LFAVNSSIAHLRMETSGISTCEPLSPFAEMISSRVWHSLNTGGSIAGTGRGRAEKDSDWDSLNDDKEVVNFRRSSMW